MQLEKIRKKKWEIVFIFQRFENESEQAIDVTRKMGKFYLM